METFTSKIEKINSTLWYHGFLVPDKISKKYITGNKRVIVVLNEKEKLHAALMPVGNGKYFINVNKEIRKKLGLEHGVKFTIQIEKDESKYGIPMPEEMHELLKIDDEADKYFHELTMGKQRSLLYIIGKPKNSDTRLKKAIVVTEYLKRVKGKLDFKELNEAFKENRGI